MGRDFDNIQSIDITKFTGFRHCSTRHAGQFRIKSKIVLEGNGGEGLILVLNLDTLFCFECLMQAFRVAPAFHHTTGELVDNDDLIVFDDIVGVDLEQCVGFKGLINVMHDRNIVDVV